MGARSGELEGLGVLRADRSGRRRTAGAGGLRRQRGQNRRQLRPRRSGRSQRRAVVRGAGSRGRRAADRETTAHHRHVQDRADRQANGLKPVHLRGQVAMDPRPARFLQHRHRGAQSAGCSDGARRKSERSRLDSDRSRCSATRPATASSREMRREGRRSKRSCGDVPWHRPRHRLRVHASSNPERPGEYCFPPLASLITGGSTSDAGAARALRDRSGRHVRDGRHRLHGDRGDAARRPDRVRRRPVSEERQAGDPALSWAQVDAIAKRFEGAEPLRSHRNPRLGAQDRRRQLRPRRPGGSGSCVAWRSRANGTRSSCEIRYGRTGAAARGRQ